MDHITPGMELQGVPTKPLYQISQNDYKPTTARCCGVVVPLLKAREPYLLASFWVSVEEGVSVKIQGEVPFVVPRYLKHLNKGRFAEQNLCISNGNLKHWWIRSSAPKLQTGSLCNMFNHYFDDFQHTLRHFEPNPGRAHSLIRKAESPLFFFRSLGGAWTPLRMCSKNTYNMYHWTMYVSCLKLAVRFDCLGLLFVMLKCL